MVLDEPIFAGYLCSTHVGKTLRIEGIEGVCSHISLTVHKPTVKVVLLERGDRREDGSIRRVAHGFQLDPRVVVQVVED